MNLSMTERAERTAFFTAKLDAANIPMCSASSYGIHVYQIENLERAAAVCVPHPEAVVYEEGEYNGRPTLHAKVPLGYGLELTACCTKEGPPKLPDVERLAAMVLARLDRILDKLDLEYKSVGHTAIVELIDDVANFQVHP